MLGFGQRQKKLALILKQTWVKLTDNTSVRWVKVFQLYGGFSRQYSKIAFYIKGSSRIVTPPMLNYKGYTTKIYKKGSILKTLVTHQKYPIV